MKEHYNPIEEADRLRDKIIGLGERSYRKSYYPELQRRLADLERFKTLMDQINDAIFLVDLPGGRIADANYSASAQTGYSMDELKRLKLADIIRDKRSELEKLFSGEVNSVVMECKLTRRNRADITYEMSMRRVRFRNIAYVVAIARDITSRKEAEKELLKANTQAELYLDLMSHDINNMNQAAMGFLELALERLHEICHLTADDEQLISQAIEDLQNSSMLIDNVKKLRKARSGNYAPTEVDVARMLLEVKDSMSSVRGRDVEIRLQAVTGCTVCAGEMLRDVFANIVGNAIKHSKGPLTVDIRLDTEEIDGRTHCRIVIEDNGPGIPDDKKRGLFDIRQRGKARISGRGLGLYIVKTLVDEFDGEIRVENRVPGDYTQGSRFIILLPAIEPKSKDTTSPPCQI